MSIDLYLRSKQIFTLNFSINYATTSYLDTSDGLMHFITHNELVSLRVIHGILEYEENQCIKSFTINDDLISNDNHSRLPPMDFNVTIRSYNAPTKYSFEEMFKMVKAGRSLEEIYKEDDDDRYDFIISFNKKIFIFTFDTMGFIYNTGRSYMLVCSSRSDITRKCKLTKLHLEFQLRK